MASDQFFIPLMVTPLFICPGTGEMFISPAELPEGRRPFLAIEVRA